MTAKDDRELVLDRLLDAPRRNVWRCWTEPELITRWFAPAPWTTPRAEVDLRPGGASRVVMASPEGEEFPSNGIYLEVVPNEKLVFTDAYVGGWRPSEKPFFTCHRTLRRRRQDAICRHGAALDHGGQGSAREDGVPRRLEPVRRPAGEAGEIPLSEKAGHGLGPATAIRVQATGRGGGGNSAAPFRSSRTTFRNPIARYQGTRSLIVRAAREDEPANILPRLPATLTMHWNGAKAWST